MSSDAIDQLSASVDGGLLRPGDDGYDDSREVWNARFLREPAAAVRCRDAGDVAAAVKAAAADGLGLSVKGGGHSYAGNTVAEGSLLIDLSPMTSIEVDAAARTATVGGGVTCGQLDAAAQAHGLATPLPTVSSVGVAGAAQGGGSGYLSPKYGLTLDNMVAAEVVTADGRQARASADENADLFWALRGAGANFGVITSMTLQLHPVGPEVLAGQIICPFDDAARLLSAFRDYYAEAPEEFSCFPFMFRVPPIDPFPAAHHGQPVIDFVFCHLDRDAAEAIEPLRSLGETVLDVVAPQPYTAVQQTFDPNLPAQQRYYSKAHYLAELSDDAIDTVTEWVPKMQGPLTAAYFEPSGGAVGRVAPDATAYGERAAAYGFHILGGWMEAGDDAEVMAWTSGFHDAMARHAMGSVYVNLLADDETTRVPDAYGANYERLCQLKASWDPDNLFRGNHNIPPAGA